jgi:transposase
VAGDRLKINAYIMCIHPLVLLYFSIMRSRLKVTSTIYSREDILDMIDDANHLKDKKASRRLQAVLHAFSGRYSTHEIAKLVDCSASSVTNWVRQWNEGGPLELVQNNYKRSRKPALTPEIVEDLLAHLVHGLVAGEKNMQVWLKERHGLDLSMSAVKYWYNRIIDSLCNKKELEWPKEPPENPHEVDLDKRREKADRAKLRAERERLKELAA